MNISKKKWLTLSSCMVSLAALMLQACTEAKETDCDKLCGNWVSVGTVSYTHLTLPTTPYV